MIRDDRFVLSRKQHALKLDSYRERYRWPREHDGGETVVMRVDAVWYRRKRGVTYACIGFLSDLTDPPPATVEEFLAGYTEDLAGPVCEGRWDGTRYWGAQEPELIEAHLAILRPMMDDFPLDREGNARPPGT